MLSKRASPIETLQVEEGEKESLLLSFPVDDLKQFNALIARGISEFDDLALRGKEDQGTQKEQANERNLVAALKALHKELSTDIKMQTQKKQKIAEATIQLIIDLQTYKSEKRENRGYQIIRGKIPDKPTSNSKVIDSIQSYENKRQAMAQSTTGCAFLLKAMATVAMAAVGFLLGAVIGAGIGIAAGIWSGPGAVVTGTLGLVKGAVTGTSVGLMAGAAATGIGTSALSNFLFFRKPKLERVTQSVIQQANKFVGPKKSD